jgi:hypothetical protein
LASDYSSIPRVKGVYLVLNPTKKGEFLTIGTGGLFKGKNPNISISELKANWVDDTIVVYIGKAGKDGSSATLRSRLKQYFGFGRGKSVGHWGGRYIWQLKDSGDLVVCWKALPKNDPKTLESELIQYFISIYSKRPFANLSG